MTVGHEGEERGGMESELATVSPDRVIESEADTIHPEGVEPTPPPSVEPFRHIGRHVVIRKLGAGAMGVVFAAYDPELDRKLAIKLIRPSAKLKVESQERMQREAQAMAKVSHPNVISIYDVGTFEGQVYIAMEMVAGASLREWLDEHPVAERKIDRVLDLFVQAGRGLAAAHEVKLVHRDFKPDNVLVGDDGRVRVLDFGLARAVDHADAAAADSNPAGVEKLAATLDQDQGSFGSQSSRGSLLDQEMTRAGSLVGTPAYMPPEHLGGARTDARGDQFSFCVALWEGVYGQRPFVGDNVAHMFGALISGRVDEPPSERRAAVPDWLHEAMLRGISTDPKLRWPDMSALLEALTPPPPKARWWLVAGGATLVVAALALGLWSNTRSHEPALCTGFDAQLVGVWDDSRRAALRAAFEASERGYASASADAVIESLDGWTAAWLAMREDTCAATHLRGDQSPELLDLRMACLDRRLAQLGALVEVLQGADEEVIERAPSAASSLEGLGGCADIERLKGGVGPPRDPGLAAEVAELEAALDHVEALHAAGRYVPGLARADELHDGIEASAWPPLQGRYGLVRARLLAHNGKMEAALEPIVAALAHAGRIDDHHLAASALVELLWTIRRAHDHHDELELWSTLATSAVARSGDVLLEARLHRALGKARWEQGRYDEALVELEATLALREAKLGSQHLLVAESRMDLGHIYQSKGEIDRARTIFEDGRARYVAELGPSHPKVSGTDTQLGSLAWRVGDYEGALKYYERALEVRERALGAQHPALSGTIGNLGATYGMMEQYEKSITYFERAVDILRDADDPALLASNLDNLAGAEAMLKHFDRAREVFREAYQIRREIYEDDHPNLARSLINMAQLEIEAGDPEQARVMLEQALELREGVEVEQVYRARARWKLAEALWELGQNERVPELLDGAREDYAAAGMAGHEQDQFEAKAVVMLNEAPEPKVPR